MSNAFLYRMPAGIPGNVNRASTATVEAQLLDAVNYPTAFGVPVAIDAASHATRKIMAGDTAVNVYGFNVRPYVANSNTDPIGTSTPPVSGICNVLKRGYINVQLNGTAPAAKNGTVYIRVGGAAAGKPLGGVEAAADATPANSIALPSNCYFTGPADANGIAELAFNI